MGGAEIDTDDIAGLVWCSSICLVTDIKFNMPTLVALSRFGFQTQGADFGDSGGEFYRHHFTCLPALGLQGDLNRGQFL